MNVKRVDCVLQKEETHNTTNKHICLRDYVHKALCTIYEECQKLLFLSLERVCVFSVVLTCFPLVTLKKPHEPKKEKKLEGCVKFNPKNNNKSHSWFKCSA